MRRGHGVVHDPGYRKGSVKWARIEAELREEEPKPEVGRKTGFDASNSCGRQKPDGSTWLRFRR